MAPNQSQVMWQSLPRKLLFLFSLSLSLFNWDTDSGLNLEWMEFTCCVECTFHRKTREREREREKKVTKWFQDWRSGITSFFSSSFRSSSHRKNRTFSSSFQFREKERELLWKWIESKKVWNDLLVEDWICFFLSLVFKPSLFFASKNVRVKVIGSIHSHFPKVHHFSAVRAWWSVQAFFWGRNCSFFSFKIQSFLFKNSCDSCADWTLIEKEGKWFWVRILVSH